MDTLKENYEHSLYKHCDEKDADAIAYAFVNAEKFVQFPYKLPQLADDEIRANVLYAGLCLSDSKTARSQWGPAMYPLAPGHEVIGVVDQIGANVTNYKRGDKVAFGTLRDCCETCKYCTMNKEPLCTGGRHGFTYGLYWGGYSTHIQQPARFFFRLAENFDLQRGAPLLCAGITVYNPFKQYLKPGFKTAVIGIGGLGHLAVKFLAKMGYEVTAVTTSKKNSDFFKSLGATYVISVDDPQDMINNQGKFDFMINTAPASGSFDKYLTLAASCGIIVQVGIPAISESVNIGLTHIAMRELHLVGSLIGSRADIKEMLSYCVENDIYPIVEEYSFEDFPKALDKLENGKPFFRCVVNVGDYARKKGLLKD